MNASHLAAALAGQYAVERELGGGAMSQVFVARDEAIGRRVVIKLLHHEMGATVNLERFRREIRVASALVHPHIVPLLDAGEVNGWPFYTMPFVEGESLRARLRQEGRLTVDVAIRLAGDVADALDYAHRQGIVHRDIKPENILLHDGHALVTDFGIARAVSEASAAGTLTQVGVAIGTPAYMSPEQASGEVGVDARADIYSLGCVLHEMLVGAPPFEGTSARAVMAKHVSVDPPRVRASRPDVPSAIDAVVLRALAKEPGDRFESAAALAQALATGAARRDDASDDGHSIAVLPFANLGADAGDDYLSDGITEEILTALTRLEGVRVAARTSSFTFRGRGADARDIARRLDVRHLLQGSVRRVGTRLRVSAQLVDAGSGYQLWSEKYDRELSDLFAIQDEIAALVAARLEAQFHTDRNVPGRPRNLDAYDACLRGRFALNQGTAESWRRSLEWFGRAIDLDPGYADAHAGLAAALCFLSFFTSNEGYTSGARRAAARALELNPKRADATAITGFIKCWFDWDFAGGADWLARAIGFDPRSADAHVQLAILCANLGHEVEARTHAERAIALDPLWPNAHHALQYSLLLSGRFEESIARANLALELAPGAVNALLPLAWASVELGRFERAHAVFAEMRSRLGADEPMALGGLAVVEARAGNTTDARGWLARLEAAPPTSVSLAHLTWAHAALGQTDQAFAWLDRAIDARDQFATCMPAFCWWDPLRSDPRFLAALRRAGYPESSFGRTYQFIDAARSTGGPGGRGGGGPEVTVPGKSTVRPR